MHLLFSGLTFQCAYFWDLTVIFSSMSFFAMAFLFFYLTMTGSWKYRRFRTPGWYVDSRDRDAWCRNFFTFDFSYLLKSMEDGWTKTFYQWYFYFSILKIDFFLYLFSGFSLWAFYFKILIGGGGKILQAKKG